MHYPVQIDDELWTIGNEKGNLNYILSEYANDGLIYHYTINDKLNHSHSFDGVLEALINNIHTFNIPNECEDEYSKQELRFINKILMKGAQDE